MKKKVKRNFRGIKGKWSGKGNKAGRGITGKWSGKGNKRDMERIGE